MSDKFKFTEEERKSVKDLFDEYSTKVYLHGEIEFVNPCIDRIESIIQDHGNSIQDVEEKDDTKKIIEVVDCMECPLISKCSAWNKLTPQQRFTLKVGIGIGKFILKDCPLPSAPKQPKK